MSRIITVASAQLGAIEREESRESVINRMTNMMRQAHSRGATIVVYPEMALTTFFPRWHIEDEAELDSFYETEMPSSQTQPLFDLSKKLGVGFYLGYSEMFYDDAGRKRRFNTSILVDQQAIIVGKYRKVHLPGHSEFDPERQWQHLEKRYFEPGDLGFPVWRTMGGVMGMCICNDRRWPETFRVMGLQGVELVMLGYNTPTLNSLSGEETAETRMHHNHLSMQAGAYQNACWVAGVAKAGSEDGHDLMAGSCIINPNGEIVAMSETNHDELIVHDCDLDACAFLKQTTFKFDAHRRVEHYDLICSQTGAVPPPD